MKKVLKLATRKSLLAWAQSSAVARQVESLNPNIVVELVGIETRGDVLLDVPLSQVAGKEFFVAELDRALAAEEVDFTVHSMKDLSLDRPPAFTLGAIPKRENPRDVVLWGPRTLERLRAGKLLRVGTSSPRRLENLPSFLERALPRFSPTHLPQLEFVEIRGNVNTRLSRVQMEVDSPKYLDGVVLAFAGLIRLWNDVPGRAELEKLLQKVHWMILPLKECPAAPAQGALAIECRSNDLDTLACLRKIHDEETACAVAAERKVLADWGGGCHQRFGATSIKSKECGDLLFIRGVRSVDQVFVEELRWHSPRPNQEDLRLKAWDGSQCSEVIYDDLNTIPDLTVESADTFKGSKKRAVFVAHSRVMQSDRAVERLAGARIWTSGVKSWFKLAAKGVWVEGCAESFGFEYLMPTIEEKILQLESLKNWLILTHADAKNSWKSFGCEVVPVYKINFHYGEEVRRSIAQAKHVFWSSGSQFDQLHTYTAPDVIHYCGPGKTAVRIREVGKVPQVFVSIEEWQKCFKREN